MFDSLIYVFFLAGIGIFGLLSMIFAGLAGLIWGSTVAIWVFIVGMIFGFIWMIYCLLEK